LLTGELGNKSEGFTSVASNPEFLREGSAIDDFNNPPFTIIGTVDEQGAMLEQLCRDIPAQYSARSRIQLHGQVLVMPSMDLRWFLPMR
jgi:UDP-glucose 6-dehydrogenase